MADVVIFGLGDFAEIADVYLQKDSPHKVQAFCVHQQYRNVETLRGKPVVPFESLVNDYPPGQVELFVAIGFKRTNQARAEVYDACKALGYRCITYVNSKATQWGEFTIGENSFVFENNVIQPFVTIGNDVILWCGNHIGHHAQIGNHCFITSHVVVSGRARIGDYSFLGVNSTIADGVSVSSACVIGAGALIMRDTVEKGVYKGPKAEQSPVTSDKLKGF